MGIKIRLNVPQLEASIAQTADRALANGARSMRRIAERIQKEAIDNAPVDDGDLESAIKILPGKDANRRKTFTVYVDPDAPVTPHGPKDEDKTVGEYAMLMEEGYYNLGPGSDAKAAGGKNVGRRYFARAVRTARDRALRDVGDAVKAVLRGSGARIVPARTRLRRVDDGGEE